MRTSPNRTRSHRSGSPPSLNRRPNRQDGYRRKSLITSEETHQVQSPDGTLSEKEKNAEERKSAERYKDFKPSEVFGLRFDVLYLSLMGRQEGHYVIAFQHLGIVP